MGKAIRGLASLESHITTQDFKEGDINVNNETIMVDFSSPEALSSILDFCTLNALPLVTGTTGFTFQHNDLIMEAQNRIPILVASNMSLGIASLKKSIGNFLKDSDSQLQCVLTEIHHINKVDSPSGTALEILDYLEQFPETQIERPISIQSLRLGEIFGIHRVEFRSEKSSVYFQHIANSRGIFARGAIYAAKWMISQPKGLYTFSDFLDKKL